VSVAICGSECNTFVVDRTRENWFGELQEAVKQALVDCGTCKEADTVTLTDVRGKAIAATATVHEMRNVGAIYPVINGSLRSIDTPISRTTIGAGATTPISHSVNKEYHLEDRIEEMCNAGCAMIVSELAKCKSLLDVQMVIKEGSQLEERLNELIEEHIEGLAEIHSDRAVMDALDNEEIALSDFAGDMTEMLLKESAEFVAHNMERYAKYFKAREMSDSNMIHGSLIGNKQSPSQSRSIYGTKTDMEMKEMQAIAAEYRTPDKIHAQVLGPALTQNEALGRKLVLVIKDGPHCHKRARHRKHKHHQHDHSCDHCGGAGCDHCGTGHGHKAVLSHGKDGSCKCHSVRGHSYERFFKSRHDQRLIETYRRSHRLKRLPAFPGVENWHHGSRHGNEYGHMGDQVEDVGDEVDDIDEELVGDTIDKKLGKMKRGKKKSKSKKKKHHNKDQGGGGGGGDGGGGYGDEGLTPSTRKQQGEFSVGPKGSMNNYSRGGGGSPGSGAWNKTDGGSSYGAGTTWKQGGENPGNKNPMAPAREPGLPGGVQAAVPAEVSSTVDASANIGAGMTLKDLMKQAAAERQKQQQQKTAQAQAQVPAVAQPQKPVQGQVSVHRAPPTKVVAEPPSLETVSVTASIRRPQQTTEPPSLETATVTASIRRPQQMAEPPSLEDTAAVVVNSNTKMPAPIADSLALGDMPSVPNVDAIISRLNRSLGRPGGK